MAADEELRSQLDPGTAMRLQALADLAERFSAQLRHEAAVWHQPAGTDDDGPEVAVYGGKILLRSRRDPRNVVELTRDEWRALTAAVRAGEFGG